MSYKRQCQASSQRAPVLTKPSFATHFCSRFQNFYNNFHMKLSGGKSEVFQVYSIEAASSIPAKANSFGGSLHILFRWKRSVYQLLWKHMLVYGILYILLSAIYQFILNGNGKSNFRALAEYFAGYSRSINLMIMLGFFTSTAMQRLFTMQTTIPGTAKSITVFIFSLKPNLPEGPMIIERFSRWQVLAWVLTFRVVCKPLRKIFPDLLSMKVAGLLTEEEFIAMERAELTNKDTPRPLIVIDWMLLLLKETFIHERFFTEFNFLKNVEALMAFKKSCGNTIKFSTQNIPPAIIQAVILAVYGFGIVTLFARSFTKVDAPISDNIIAYFPIMPAMQFFIYFAWLCFGKAAVDPFGDDDDDINVKQLVEAHISDSKRLMELYSRNMEDVFPNLPYRSYNDRAEL